MTMRTMRTMLAMLAMLAMRTGRRPGRSPAATGTRTLRAAALAGALALAACGGGGGTAPPPDIMPPPDDTPPPIAEPAAALVTGLSFDYALERAGEEPIEETGSTPLGCPFSGARAGCPADDLRALAGRDGTGMRDGFATATGTTGGPPLTRTFAGASATVTGAEFRRYGFWGKYGWAAVEIGTGGLSASAEGQTWTGSFTAAHAWAAGEPSGTNPAGTGEATWRGIAEAARTPDFARLPGAAELRIADLSRPLIDVDIDLDDGGAGVALEWRGMPLSAGSFGKGTAGTDRLSGRFHGPGHEEAFGTFDTGAYVGAFGARRDQE